MMVATCEVILALTVLRPLQELQKLGLMKQLAPKASATFISHQWLTRSHPDPDGVQLRSLQRFLVAGARNRLRDLFSERDWVALKTAVSDQNPKHTNFTSGFSRYDGDTPDDLLSAELTQNCLWLDYLSVPQEVQPGDDSQKRAISSIPYYIEQSSFFIVLCPSVQHADTGEEFDYESWLQRGWCRFEMWSNLLSRQRVVPLVLTDLEMWTLAIDQVFPRYGTSRAAVVGCGEFGCCRHGHRREDGTPIPCDQDSILPILESMWLAKIREATEAQMPWVYGELRLLETQLFARSRDAPFRATWGKGVSDAAAPQLVLKRIELDILAGRFPTGYPVIILVAGLGDERLLQACVDRGDDPLTLDANGCGLVAAACESGSLAAVEYLLSLPSMTAEHVNLQGHRYSSLALHAAVRKERIVEALLGFRANPSLSCSHSGETPLHVAAELGQAGAVRRLLVAGAPPDARDLRGMTALHVAAEGQRMYSQRAGRLQVIQTLLDHGASANVPDHSGLTASDVASFNRFDAALSLIHGGSSAQLNRGPMGHLGFCLSCPCSVGHSC